MLDLAKNQIVEPAIEAWFRNHTYDEWIKLQLMSIDHRNSYPYKTVLDAFVQCSLTNPNLPKTKPWQIVSDIPDEAWGGWILHAINKEIEMIEPKSIRYGHDYSKDLWKPRNSNPFKGEWRKCEVIV
jgi:hypothetical protein